MPNFDIRQFHPRASIIDSPEPERALAGVLGKSPAVLLKGHGVTITDSSLYGLVSRAYNLRINALIQQQAISLEGNITYLDGQAATAPHPWFQPEMAAEREPTGPGEPAARSPDQLKVDQSNSLSMAVPLMFVTKPSRQPSDPSRRR